MKVALALEGLMNKIDAEHIAIVTQIIYPLYFVFHFTSLSYQAKRILS